MTDNNSAASEAGPNAAADSSMPARVAVAAGASSEEAQARAADVASELNLPLVDRADGASGFDLLLVVNERRLELREGQAKGERGVYVDFVGGPVGYRRRSALSRKQPIARAVGLRHGPVNLVDATAGLGGDAFLLAGLGCRVTAVERSPVLAAMIRDGLRRASLAGIAQLDRIFGRIRLVFDDARQFLEQIPGTEAPDVVYLDPMFPPRKHPAGVKKELRICRRLVGDDPDAGDLFAVARLVARKRVVVKRYRRAPPLSPCPSLVFAGKLVRYDVYLSCTAAPRDA